MALLNRSLPLDERINALRSEIDAFIDARVEEERKRCEYQLPAPTIRAIITRGMGCRCASYLDIKKQDDEQAARESAA